jgi:hypothetical protein
MYQMVVHVVGNLAGCNPECMNERRATLALGLAKGRPFAPYASTITSAPWATANQRAINADDRCSRLVTNPCTHRDRNAHPESR